MTKWYNTTHLFVQEMLKDLERDIDAMAQEVYRLQSLLEESADLEVGANEEGTVEAEEEHMDCEAGGMVALESKDTGPKWTKPVEEFQDHKKPCAHPDEDWERWGKEV